MRSACFRCGKKARRDGCCGVLSHLRVLFAPSAPTKMVPVALVPSSNRIVTDSGDSSKETARLFIRHGIFVVRNRRNIPRSARTISIVPRDVTPYFTPGFSARYATDCAGRSSGSKWFVRDRSGTSSGIAAISSGIRLVGIHWSVLPFHHQNCVVLVRFCSHRNPHL